MVARGHGRHRTGTGQPGLSLHGCPAAGRDVPAGDARRPLFRAAALVPESPAGDFRRRIPRPGHPLHRIPRVDAGRALHPRRRGRPDAGAAAQPCVPAADTGAFVAPEIMLENYLTARCPYDKTISFVSERRKITLDPAEILYVESNDSEVWLHTASARPTVQRRASRNGNRSSTGASCASTAPISSTRHTSANTTPRGSTSADRKSKFPANTRTPHGCGSSPLRANNARNREPGIIANTSGSAAISPTA